MLQAGYCTHRCMQPPTPLAGHLCYHAMCEASCMPKPEAVMSPAVAHDLHEHTVASRLGRRWRQRWHRAWRLWYPAWPATTVSRCSRATGAGAGGMVRHAMAADTAGVAGRWAVWHCVAGPSCCVHGIGIGAMATLGTCASATTCGPAAGRWLCTYGGPHVHASSASASASATTHHAISGAARRATFPHTHVGGVVCSR